MWWDRLRIAIPGICEQFAAHGTWRSVSRRILAIGNNLGLRADGPFTFKSSGNWQNSGHSVQVRGKRLPRLPLKGKERVRKYIPGNAGPHKGDSPRGGGGSIHVQAGFRDSDW